ncbi:hypothetical protein SynMVIR181_01915 [Synechococcus sp. MVIR-18-1]|nr:hypothetical protein SynMVIR181_01915 [Synechococcus sp. MVIR-18-1]
MMITLFIALLLLFEINNELNGSFVKLQSLEFGSALFRLRS